MRKNQIIGIILLVALALMYVNIQFISGKYISSIAILACAIYLLIKK